MSTSEVTYSVDDCEELGSGVEHPRVCVPLHECGDDEELDDAEETGVGGDRQASRELFEHRALQHQPPRPRQAVADQVHAAQRPVLGRLAAAGHQLLSHDHLLELVRAEDGRAFVERDHRRPRDASQRAHHLGNAVTPVKPDLLDPEGSGHGEGDGRDGVLDGGGECGRRVVQAKQVETLVRRDPDRSTINIMVSYAIKSLLRNP
jgi:hypothetical protein